MSGDVDGFFLNPTTGETLGTFAAPSSPTAATATTTLHSLFLLVLLLLTIVVRTQHDRAFAICSLFQ